MGRELKRVPLDFKHPLNKVWPGYVNPHYVKCTVCHDGCGQNLARVQLDRFANLLAWAAYCAADTARGRVDVRARRGSHSGWHPMFNETGIPSPIAPEFRELVDGLCRAGSVLPCKWDEPGETRTPQGVRGLGSSDAYYIERALLAAAGLPGDWGECPSCHGSGIDAAHEAAYESWTKSHPPEGPGYQVWETVSEGSPISPVFADAPAMIHWLVEHEDCSIEAATAFVEKGWVPSMVMVNDGKSIDIKVGVQAAGMFKK